MADQKKDMTGLMELAKAMQATGMAPPPPPGSVMEEQKIDKVDDFESLEDYSKAHPAAEPKNEFETSPPPEEATPPEPPPSEVGAPAAYDLPSDDAFVTTPSEQPTGLEGMEAAPPSEFPVTDGMSVLPEPVISSPEKTFSPGGDDLSALKMGDESNFLPEPAPVALASADLEPVMADGPADGIPAAISAAPQTPSALIAPPPAEIAAPETPADQIASTQMAASDEPGEPEQALMREPLRPATKTSSAPKQAMERVKQYSEQMSPGRDSVPASFPFSMLITGQLAPEEKERLTDILSRENMGFRELDLEPQFEAGKILIPRISEYAGILLVSALRSTRAKIRLGPSDSIYATADTQDSGEEDLDSGEHEVDAYSSDSWHPAEEVFITTADRFPGRVQHAVVDIVTASAALKTLVVQAESSPEYQTLLEALQRELKYKAFRKGATAIVNFSVVLTQLHMPMHYRVMVTGSAIK